MLAVAIGLGSLIFFWSFADGLHVQAIENFTSFLPGHIQIHKKEFQLRKNLSYLLENPHEIEAALNATDGIQAFTHRIEVAGLISSTLGNSSALILAVDPAREPKVTRLEKILRQGNFLSGERNEIVLGSLVAKKIGAEVGSKVVLMTESVFGSLAGESFRVAGIFESGAETMDAWVVYVPLAPFQEMVEAGDRVTNVVIRTHDVQRLENIVGDLKGKFSADLEVLGWKEISPMLAEAIAFDDAMIFICVLIVLIVVAAGVTNTLLMSIMERLREFGVMMALGTKGYQVGILVLVESLFLVGFGICGGIIFGTVTTLIFHHIGIDVSNFSQALGSYFIGTVTYPALNLDHLALSSITILVATILVSLYPARRSAKLNPIEAMTRL